MSDRKSLLDLIAEAIDAGSVSLPARNQTAQRLQAILNKRDVDVDEVLAIVAEDQALTTEILRVANSPFYGGLSEITTVRNAVVRIGGPEVVRLTIAAIEKEDYRVRSPQLAALMQPLWDHAMGVALGARWLANRLGFHDLESEAFIAGLLHDVGKLLLVRVLDDLHQGGDLPADFPDSVVREVLDSGHTEYGHKLLAHWGVPDLYRIVVRDHHTEPCDQHNSLLLMVRLANKACASLGIGLHQDPSLTLAATEEAHALDARDVMLAELSIMLEDTQAITQST